VAVVAILTISADDANVVSRSETKGVVIDGLKLTMTGAVLQTKLEERIQWHLREVRRNYEDLQDPTRNEKKFAWPEGVLEGAIAKGEAQIEVLTLIRDHILADEVYRLGEYDLRFADLLPDEEDWDCGQFAQRSGRVEAGMHQEDTSMLGHLSDG